MKAVVLAIQSSLKGSYLGGSDGKVESPRNVCQGGG